MTISSSCVMAEEIQDKMPAEIQQIAGEYFGDGKPIVGGVIGIVDGPKKWACGFGQITLQSSYSPENTPDIDTVYEIASLTKTFTGTLLGEMAARHEVAIDDPLDKYVPKEVAVPDWHGQKITLEDLASHCSGIPRLPANFWEIADKSPDNPYQNYTTAEIEKFLSGYTLEVAPKTRYEYSNVGASILGHALELKTGKIYETLVQERIGKPLGLRNTSQTLTDDMRARLAPPYDEKKNLTSNWDLPGFAGGGGLRSSMRDMLRYAQASACFFDAFPELKADPDHPLILGIREAERLHFTDERQNIKMGLGWHISGKGEVKHNGQTGGYHSYIVVSPEKHRAVVVLTNTAVDVSDQMAKRIWEQLETSKK